MFAGTFTATTFITLGEVSIDRAGAYTLDVQASGAVFTLTPRGVGYNSTRTLGTSAPTLFTESRSTPSTALTGNQITADGLYAVEADGMRVGLDLVVTSGTVTISADPVVG